MFRPLSFPDMQHRLALISDKLSLTRSPISGTDPPKYRYTVACFGKPSASEEKNIRLRFANHPHIAERYLAAHKEWEFVSERLWVIDSIVRMVERGDVPGDSVTVNKNKPARNV